eukprot:364778-Chlamydomonas_euryale.AAC.3
MVQQDVATAMRPAVLNGPPACARCNPPRPVQHTGRSGGWHAGTRLPWPATGVLTERRLRSWPQPII